MATFNTLVERVACWLRQRPLTLFSSRHACPGYATHAACSTTASQQRYRAELRMVYDNVGCGRERCPCWLELQRSATCISTSRVSTHLVTHPKLDVLSVIARIFGFAVSHDDFSLLMSMLHLRKSWQINQLSHKSHSIKRKLGHDALILFGSPNLCLRALTKTRLFLNFLFLQRRGNHSWFQLLYVQV